MSNSKNLLLIIILASPLVLLSWLLNGRLLGIDDADIFFTYANNLAIGNGITYSRDILPVEGYTSMLWMLLSSFIFLIGFDEAGVFFAVLILFAATHFFALKMIDNFCGHDSILAKLIYLGLVFSSFGYVTWSLVTLMDGVLHGFLIILLVYSFVADPKKNSEWLALLLPYLLAPLVRPETILLVPALIVLNICYRYLNEKSFKPVIICSIVFLFSFLLLTLFRLYTFGFILPNTYYAKVSPNMLHNLQEGWAYFRNYLIETPIISFVFIAGPFAALLLIFKLKKRLSGHVVSGVEVLPALYIFIFAFVLLALPVLKGGDHFNLYRFYQPYYPVFVLCFILFGHEVFKIDWLAKNIISKFIVIFCFILFVIFHIYSIFSMRSGYWAAVKGGSPISHEFLISRAGRDLGLRLDQIFNYPEARLPSIGVITAGGISRTYPGPIYDLMGLNNSYMAHYPGDKIGIKNHAAFEKGAFYNLPIDLIVDSPDNPFVAIALKGLFLDVKFINSFKYGAVSRVNGNGIAFEGFYGNVFLDGLNPVYFNFKETRAFDDVSNSWIPVK